jgi:tetratricopeptide (TPR) repeat protein
MAPDHTEIQYWRTFLENKKLDVSKLNPDLVFPFRQETAEVLQELISSNDHWMLKYHLALIHWNWNNLEDAKELFSKCGQEPGYAPFYAARAELNMKTEGYDVAGDFQKAMDLDRDQWRYGKSLVNYYISEKKYDLALPVAREYYNRFRGSYIMEMLYAKTLIKNNQHKEALDILKKTFVLPYEGATESQQLYKEANLSLAVNEIAGKNYRKALSYISASRQWPENLGAGKPYDTDIDDRLEDWLAYKSYKGMGNEEAAKAALEKILLFKPQKTYYLNTFSSANNLVTAWAMNERGWQDKAEEYLQSWITREPQSDLAKCVMKKYSDKESTLLDSDLEDNNLRMLNYYTNHLK